jgi:hypothetical protein
MQHHEHWEFWFRTLFPNEPFPASIYLLPKQEEYRNFLDSWVWSAGMKVLNDIRCQALPDSSNLSPNEPKDIQLAAVMARFITIRLQDDLTEERLYADFAKAQQDFERLSSSPACVPAVANHQPLTAPGLALAHDAVAQLPTSDWNPQREPSLPWPMSTVGERTGIPGCPDTDIHALVPISACEYLSNVSSGFGEKAGISLNDSSGLASWTVQHCTSNNDGPGILGIDHPGPSSVAQWAGGYPQHEFTYLDSSHLTSGAVPGPSASAIVGVNDYARSSTTWNPLVQGENWFPLEDPFNQGFGPFRILDDGMTSGWPRAGGLQPISEMSEL